MTRILVVEDEISFSDPLSYLLSKEGYDVEVVDNGPAALTAFDSNGADLVLLDLMLPGLSGIDICRSIRQRSNVPVIIMPPTITSSPPMARSTVPRCRRNPFIQRMNGRTKAAATMNGTPSPSA